MFFNSSTISSYLASTVVIIRYRTPRLNKILRSYFLVFGNCGVTPHRLYRGSLTLKLVNHRSSHPEVFLRKDVMKINSKFTGKHPCRSVISIKFLCNFIDIALRHGCSPVNLLHIVRTPFPRNTSGWLFLQLQMFTFSMFLQLSSQIPISLLSMKS